MRRAAGEGFTLIELLLVLALMALLTVFGLPRLTGVRGKAELQASAHEIAAALRGARIEALHAGRSSVFTIDTRSGRYQTATSSSERLPNGVRPILVTATREQLDAASGNIRFFADGSSTGGGVRLVQGNREYDVLVDWLTGRVSIEAR
jgi:general secretion pathway protein H